MSNYQPKNILITGGSGFIGSHHILYTLEKYNDVKIVNLDLLTYAAIPENLSAIESDPRYCFQQGDIRDQGLVVSLLKEHNIDTVIHFAAESHVDRSITGPEAFIDTNVKGTFHLLEAVRQVWLTEKSFDDTQCRFHHVSTDEVFGTLDATEPAFTEKHQYQPNSPYSASKAASDHLVRSYYHTFGLPVSVSNCSNNYGPHQHSEKFIPTVIRSCAEQKAIPVYGNGSNIRDWLFVKDHCSGVDAIIRQGKPGEQYNLGGENEVDNLALAKHICQAMDKANPQTAPHEKLIEFVTDRAGHDWRYAIDISKAKAELNWQPETTFADGLKKTIEYYT
tara:strand:- start:192671 stop:193675 length:1005 start_codon:yes stop_codon:yes gene_type:complete